MKRTRKSCESCISWDADQSDHVVIVGFCSKAENPAGQEDYMTDEMVAWTFDRNDCGDHATAYLVTNKSFHCAAWSKKQ